MMVAGDAHRPIITSTPPDNDIQTTESPSPTLPLGRVGEGFPEGRGGAYSHKKNGEPTVTVGIPS